MLQLAAGCCTGAGGPWGRGVLSSQPQPAPASSHGPRAEILQEFGNDIADTLRRCTVLCTNASTSLVEDPGPDSTKFGWDPSWLLLLCTWGPYVTLFLGLGTKSYISHIYSCEVDIVYEKFVRTFAVVIIIWISLQWLKCTSEGLHQPRTQCTGR